MTWIVLRCDLTPLNPNPTLLATASCMQAASVVAEPVSCAYCNYIFLCCDAAMPMLLLLLHLMLALSFADFGMPCLMKACRLMHHLASWALRGHC